MQVLFPTSQIYSCICCSSIYFILGLNFIFLCFWGMVMYDNEFETKENKIEPQHIH